MSKRTRMRAGWGLWAVGAVALVAVGASSSCTLLLGTFQGTGGEGGAASATSGTRSTGSIGDGSSTASTASTGGMGGTGGTSSASSSSTGGQPGCSSIAQCPSPPNACVQATCTAGVCGTMDLPQMVLMKHSPPDCKDSACDGNGMVVNTIDETNVPVSSNPCLLGTCDGSGTPGTTAAPSGTTCTNATNGKVCDGAGDCVQCVTSADCATGASCDVTHTCVAASCTNGVKDNSETDTDCGGPNCGPCPDLEMCQANADCIDKLCSGNICSKPTCTDGSQNGAETDIDCGGGVCGACKATQGCKANTDCVGQQCGGGKCTPNCMDGTQDNTETDIDCGGGGCTTCALGKKCLADADCGSNACDALSLKCVATQCTDNRVDGNETDVDCGGGTCPSGCATGKNCKVDGDCISSACDALSLKCVANQCADDQKDGNETDTDCGGGTCGACANTKKCKVDADCTSMACDALSLTCDPTQCSDHQKDGNETDVDCGGGTCSACPTGKGCKANSDCTSSACDLVKDLCVGSTCSDERKDGTETDTDCGGGTCPACATGLKCMVDADCTTNACDAVSLLCVASQCADHRKDGIETDTDCGGGICPTACALGKLCQLDTDCMSAACDALSTTCINNQCADHRQDGTESDVDCGGAVCNSCAVGQKCNNSFDCAGGHSCTTSVPHVCQ
jgi:hypothetical protein